MPCCCRCARKLAAAQLRLVELRVADATLQTAADARRAFYTYQARRQLIDRLQLVADTNGAAADFTRSLHDAGNVNDLDLVNQQAAFSQSKIDVAQAKAQTLADREAVNRLLGLDGAQASAWTAEKSLPPIPGREPSVGALEARAVAQRLGHPGGPRAVDRRRAGAGVEGGIFALVSRRACRSAWTPNANPRANTSPARRSTSNCRSSTRARGKSPPCKARDLQARRQLEAKIIDAKSEVRAFRTAVMANRELAESINNTVLPQRRQVFALTLQQYNGMLKGAYDLLTAKASEAAAERSYLEAWRDYWIARADLERAVGGRLR